MEKKKKKTSSSSSNKSRGGGGGTTKSSKSPYHEVADLIHRVWGTTTTNNNKSNNKSKLSSRSLKSVVFDKHGNLCCSKRSYAVATKVLHSQSTLQKIIENAAPTLLSSKSTVVKNHALLFVLLYELLLSPHQCIHGGGALKRHILSYETQLREHAMLNAKIDISTNIKNNNDFDDGIHSGTKTTTTSLFPRYVRVNTCTTSTVDFIKYIQPLLQQQQQQKSQYQPPVMMAADAHVPDLLVLPLTMTSTLLSAIHSSNNKDTYNSTNSIVLQDKSSCFPALCLMDLLSHSQQGGGGGGDILDACAAPGNKTCHIAALLATTTMSAVKNNKNKQQKLSVVDDDVSTTTTIYALDRDQGRYQSLQSRMKDLVPTSTSSKTAAAAKVVVQHVDFLSTLPTEYSTVTAILLDPSCSGSGIYSRTSRSSSTGYGNGDDDEDTVVNNDNSDTEQRLQKLSGFQITALRHAMSFPNVHTIVYSTCSIHVEENENVIAAALYNNNSNNHDSNDDDQDEWQIVAPPCLSHWTRRGIPDTTATTDTGGGVLSVEELQCMIRTNQDDETNGFFVACLQRKSVVANSSAGIQPRPRRHVVNQNLGIPIYNTDISNQWRSSSNQAAAAVGVLEMGSGSGNVTASIKKTAQPQLPTLQKHLSRSNPKRKRDDTETTAATATSPTSSSKRRGKGGVHNATTTTAAGQNTDNNEDDNDDGDDDTSTRQGNAVRAKRTNNSGTTQNTPPKLEEKTKTKGHITGPQYNSTTAATMNKKRAKALEWKRRQHEAKVARTKNS